MNRQEELRDYERQLREVKLASTAGLMCPYQSNNIQKHLNALIKDIRNDVFSPQ